MSNQPTDFVWLYQQLGLAPDGGLAELKSAYRRRVAELHPDRNPQPAAAAELQELTAAYQAAVAFERRHGRLPGARARNEPAAETARPSARPPDATRRTGLRRVVFIALAAAAIGWVGWTQIGGSQAPLMDDPADEPRFVEIPSQPFELAHENTVRIELGMEAAAVRTIEGRPVMESAERWDYGPSWVEFEHGRVSDWYSSRLRPLKVSKPRPAAK